MYFSVHELVTRKMDFAQTFAPGKLDLGEELVQKADLKAKGRAELIEEHHGPKKVVQDIRVVGDFSTRVELKCARCLDPVVRDLSGEIDLLYRPLGTNADKKDDSSISEQESEIGYYQGDGVELADVLKEQVLLSVPIRELCSPDCKGLCPLCGQNRNLKDCHCRQEQQDPRWNALADIKKTLK